MINLGDLVKCRDLGQKVGLVVDKKISNEGLANSYHTRHVLSTYPYVYYVYFSGIGKSGPYHESDLSLQQSSHFYKHDSIDSQERVD